MERSKAAAARGPPITWKSAGAPTEVSPPYERANFPVEESEFRAWFVEHDVTLTQLEIIDGVETVVFEHEGNKHRHHINKMVAVISRGWDDTPGHIYQANSELHQQRVRDGQRRRKAAAVLYEAAMEAATEAEGSDTEEAAPTSTAPTAKELDSAVFVALPMRPTPDKHFISGFAELLDLEFTGWPTELPGANGGLSAPTIYVEVARPQFHLLNHLLEAGVLPGISIDSHNLHVERTTLRIILPIQQRIGALERAKAVLDAEGSERVARGNKRSGVEGKLKVIVKALEAAQDRAEEEEELDATTAAEDAEWVAAVQEGIITSTEDAFERLDEGRGEIIGRRLMCAPPPPPARNPMPGCVVSLNVNTLRGQPGDLAPAVETKEEYAAMTDIAGKISTATRPIQRKAVYAGSRTPAVKSADIPFRVPATSDGMLYGFTACFAPPLITRTAAALSFTLLEMDKKNAYPSLMEEIAKENEGIAPVFGVFDGMYFYAGEPVDPMHLYSIRVKVGRALPLEGTPMWAALPYATQLVDGTQLLRYQGGHFKDAFNEEWEITGVCAAGRTEPCAIAADVIALAFSTSYSTDPERNAAILKSVLNSANGMSGRKVSHHTRTQVVSGRDEQVAVLIQAEADIASSASCASP